MFKAVQFLGNKDKKITYTKSNSRFFYVNGACGDVITAKECTNAEVSNSV